jgi:putative phage-type endonuclease
MLFRESTATTNISVLSANGHGNANGSLFPSVKKPGSLRQPRLTVKGRGAASAVARRLESELEHLEKQPVEVVDFAQGSREWFAFRRDKRTASETPIVMGLSPWSTPQKLAKCKYCDHDEVSGGNKFTNHGHRFEDAARKFYEAITDVNFEPATAVRGQYSASLDGWSEDRTVILEIKCPFTRKNGDTWQSCLRWRVPEHYLAQVQHQLMVSGAEIAHFVVFDPDDAQMLRVKVLPDPDFYKKIVAAWATFEAQFKTTLKGQRQETALL